MNGGKGNKTYADALGLGQLDESKDPCTISKKIQLQRVDPSQARALKPKDRLPLRTRKRGKVTSVICVRPNNGAFVGSVAFSGIKRLIECMDDGNDYVAIVEKISGAAVQVEITNA